jgi:hypothetical protein
VPIVATELYVQGDFQAEEIGQVVTGLQTVQRRLQAMAAEAIRLREDVL